MGPGWWRKVRALSVNDRQAAAMATVSGAVLVALIVVWLTVSTRTALLNQQLDELDAKHARLTDEINRTWMEIGETTSLRAMEDRARRLGFQPAERIEYLVIAPEGTPAVTATHSTRVRRE
ncbi:MAG: hypothetical protein RMN52_01390 [Anaerolineae bacterium]|nr:hypothetical protein [Candidatus Roseilinea sp.]MDW8448632.1 hypothetical protein [Anaerolineae bacterium]